ncbi:hypothetical protein PVT67_01025 [Gallaecimonas kandeliae]|uniref:hypothetical protein n=1 Tax=Gallaecimonas kandeliae TaxID=3029055 RepID=UPI002648CAD4|nr:hypothetical protein [Gallaecimonas kandeliae]WKE65871.1 hypothetical protein PVT67_01025 [Gallaecimonas kandeliae]
MNLYNILLSSLFALCALVCLHLLSQLVGLLLFRAKGDTGKRLDRLLWSLSLTLTVLLMLVTLPQVLDPDALQLLD